MQALTAATLAGVLVFAAAAPSFAGAAATGQRYQVVDLGVIQRLAVDVTPGLSRSGNTVIWHEDDAQTFTGRAALGRRHDRGRRRAVEDWRCDRSMQ